MIYITNDLEREQEEANRIGNKIAALRRLAETCKGDPWAQASITGQINALEWVLAYELNIETK